MSTMSQPIQTVEDIVPASGAQRPVSNKNNGDSGRLKSSLHMLTTIFVAPLLLILALFGFFVVVADFTWFRLRNLRKGQPRPKGLWEF